MSAPLIIAVVIVLVASVGIVLVGSAYKWDLTARGYTRWTRAIGVGAVLGLTAVTAWSRWGEPAVPFIIVGGVALAVGFVLLHRHLTARVRALLSEPPAE